MARWVTTFDRYDLIVGAASFLFVLAIVLALI